MSGGHPNVGVRARPDRDPLGPDVGPLGARPQTGGVLRSSGGASLPTVTLPIKELIMGRVTVGSLAPPEDRRIPPV